MARGDPGQSSVNPIRNEDDLKNFISFWRRKRDNETNDEKKRMYDRNYVLILLGVNSALRFSDLRRLTVGKVKNNEISQRDKKTGKENNFKLNRDIYKQVLDYIKRQGLNDDEDFLFWSRKGVNKPLTRQQGYNAIQTMKTELRIPYRLGTHTLRKTFGYWFYKQYGDVAALQTILNHSNPKTTMRYIGMLREEVDKKRQGFKLFG